jgi:ribonuclease-3
MGLEERIGHVFKKKEILKLALTHRSIVNETNEVEHNERMEFLGDAVLQLIVSQLLFEHYRDAPEGDLSKLRATAVNKEALVEHALRLDLGAHLRLGAGERRSGGSQKASLLADAFEAIVAAVYLDAGFDAAKAFVVRMFDVAGLKTRTKDPKTDLQHYCQKHMQKVPTYRLAGESGPEHERRFLCEVLVENRVLGLGEGKSKKLAEMAAATDALRKLDV